MPSTSRPSRAIRALLVAVLVADVLAAGAVVRGALTDGRTTPAPEPRAGSWGSSWAPGLPAPGQSPGMNGAATPSTEGVAARNRGLAALLNQRTQAVLRHDPAALLGTVDPSAGAFRVAQQRLASNLARLPLASWSYQQEGVAPPLRLDVAQRLGPDSWLARVVLRYRIAGFDTGEVSRTQFLTVVRRGGRWLLAGDTDGEVYGSNTERDLWDLATVQVVLAGPVLVVGAQPRSQLAEYAREASAAIPAVSEVWGSGWVRRGLLVVPGTSAQLTTLLAGRVEPGGLEQIAAMTVGRLVGDPRQGGADRILINPQPYATLRAEGRRVVLTHELTHVATRAASSEDAMPLWLVEGFADYVGWRASSVPVSVAAQELLAAVRAGRVPPALPSRSEFDAATGDVSVAYQGAWLACRLLAQRWGQPTLVRLYREVGRRVAGGAAPDDAVGAGLRELGTTTAAFTAAWQQSLREAAG